MVERVKHPRIWVVGTLILVVLLGAIEAIAPNSIVSLFNRVLADLVAQLDALFFAKVFQIPLVILWLSLGSVLVTLRLGFINIWGVRHGLRVLFASPKTPSQSGEVTSFQALSTALAATVGLGNIAGVAIAIQLGGPGAVFWMTIAAFFGMGHKFVESALAQTYRKVLPSGRILGGPMYYLRDGLAELGWPRLGRWLSGLFALLCLLSALGSGSMFQTTQAYTALRDFWAVPIWLFAPALAGALGLAILGGIERIAAVSSRLVPCMAGIYLVATLWVLVHHLGDIPAAIATIGRGVVSPTAVVSGGAIGTIVQGLRRAAFSNEAGMGSSAMAHVAAGTSHPVQEGFVALLEPAIDTIVICNLTALVILVTGSHELGLSGVEITLAAFESHLSWFPGVLAIATVLFAFSTALAWSYYGEQCWSYLIGARHVRFYRVLFIVMTLLGCFGQDLATIVDFSDMMFFAMAFPNVLGCMLLSGRVARDLRSYWTQDRGPSVGD